MTKYINCKVLTRAPLTPNIFMSRLIVDIATFRPLRSIINFFNLPVYYLHTATSALLIIATQAPVLNKPIVPSLQVDIINLPHVIILISQYLSEIYDDWFTRLLWPSRCVSQFFSYFVIYRLLPCNKLYCRVIFCSK